MSNVVDFLEMMGQEARVRHATNAELEQALTGIGIDQELRLAILAGNQQQLEALLGAATNVCCGLHPAEEDDEETEEDDDDEDEDEDDDDDGDGDTEEDEVKKSQSALHRAAATA